MIRRVTLAALVAIACIVVSSSSAEAQERAFGANWGAQQSQANYNRFYHYPYVYYPQNYWGDEYYRSADSLYYRYPQEMRVPVYNRQWRNYYPSSRRYHFGHQFVTDIF